MRILAPVLILGLLTLPSCSLSWKGREPVTSRSGKIQSVEELSANYNTRKYFRDLRRRYTGRSNAFAAGLEQINATLDRHFFNYSLDDPYLNYESDLTWSDHVLRFAGTTLAH